MIFNILIISYLVLSVVNVVFTIRERHQLDSFGEVLLILFFSVFPLLNILVTLGAISEFVQKQDNKRKKRIENDKQLKKLNKFVECNSCKMIVRKGYIIDSICPICEEMTIMNKYEEKYIPSDDIFFQKEITSLEQLEQDNLIDKTKEQNELYLSIMQKKLENKKIKN